VAPTEGSGGLPAAAALSTKQFQHAEVFGWSDQPAGYVLRCDSQRHVAAVLCCVLLCCAGVPMGIIPRGTANAFSVALGIPTHLDDPINFAKQAADVILQVGQPAKEW
jgi:hypothetical protein